MTARGADAQRRVDAKRGGSITDIKSGPHEGRGRTGKKMEYYQYFLLNGPPFQPASPDSAVYLSPTHLEGLTTLESGLSGELTGLTLLTGEAGTGKTTLIYSLLQRDYKRVRIALVDDPK